MDFSAGSMKEVEYGGSSSLQYWDNEELIPRPLEALLETGPPPFLSKTYDFVEDPSATELVSWSPGNNSFIVWDPRMFAMNVLPKYFKHNNFSSFVRQLNTYGFRRVDPDKWEFANEGFLKGQRHLIKYIIRRKTQYSSSQPSNKSLASCVEVGSSGSIAQIDDLMIMCNKQVLMMELVKLRKQQEKTLSCLKRMEQRLKWAEMKQRQTTSFLTKAIQNPTFLQQILRPKVEMKDLEEAVSNKGRRRTINHVSENGWAEELVFHEGESIGFPEVGQGSTENPYEYDVGMGQFGDRNFYDKLLEPQEYDETPRFGDSELEKLALSMQKPPVIMEGKSLVNEGIDEVGTLGAEEGGDDLAEQLELISGSNQR